MDYHSDTICRSIRCALVLGFALPVMHAESNTVLSGRVIDPSQRPVPDAEIRLRNVATRVERRVVTDNEGIYEIPGLPVGVYQMQVRAAGFPPYIVETITTEVARNLVRNVRLQMGDIWQEITVKSQTPLIDGATTSVGHLIDDRTLGEMPLNGRYFLDLAVLAPASVTPPQNGFNTTPFRGLGVLSINTAGNREDAVAYMINGVTLNDLLFNSIDFQPSISTVQEFKIDNSTLSAEYGLSSGAVVTVATRSGTNRFHVELFEFLRNDVFDARNFFNLTSNVPPPFKRNQFGGAIGGPVFRSRTFFYFSYEGLRQRQKVDLNSVVFSSAQRASASDPAIVKLIALIPIPNFVDSAGTPRFIGSAHAPVVADQTAIDISHILTERDQLHGYFSIYRTRTVEPAARGTTIPGFGYIQVPLRQFFSLNGMHLFRQNLNNEARLGMNRLSSTTMPNAPLNPAEFGIRNGITEPIGLPQMSVAGGALNFGGPSNNPSGRSDTSMMLGDIVSCACGRHSLRFGGEFRQFLNNNFRLGAGSFSFPSVAAFLAGTANSFAVTLGDQSSSIVQGALSVFGQTNYKLRPNLTFDLGLRYDWNITPYERHGRFIVFDARSGSLVRLGRAGEIYHQNNRNLGPRVGIAWDPFHNGKTALRGAYGILVGQPITNVVVGTAGNPPLATPVTVSGTVQLENAIDLARASGLAPATVDHGFDNTYLQSWNFNVQRELPRGIGVMVGYFGSKATNLIIQRNINQPIAGVRPYPVVSQRSAILPSTPLGNIMQTESTGNSTYNALWVSARKPLAHGLQIDGSYTWSKSLDYNSLSSQGVVLQDSYNLRGDRGLSDFDVRRRFVGRAIYDLPFRGSHLVDGWQVAIILQAQSGNPVNLVTTNSILTGVANTVRPNATGRILRIADVDQWFDMSVITPGPSLGSLGRNVVTGPGFNNIDFSIIKNTKVAESIRVEFRVELFDLLNHANFGQPGNVVGSPGFGRITNTRMPTGESGSSRQAQFGIKLTF